MQREEGDGGGRRGEPGQGDEAVAEHLSDRLFAPFQCRAEEPVLFLYKIFGLFHFSKLFSPLILWFLLIFNILMIFY
jgi:hypothetical protein